MGALVLTLVCAPAARALTACTAADIMTNEGAATCPNSTAPCTISKVYTVAADCTFDFSGRDVIVTAAGQLNVGSNIVSIVANNFTLNPGALIDAHVFSNASPPTGIGGMVEIDVTGNVTVGDSGSLIGEINAGGDSQGGTITIDAGGSITIAGRLIADGQATQPLACGGTIELSAGADLITQSASVISATGNSNASLGGGEVDLSAGSGINLAKSIDVSGNNGGVFDACAGGTAVVNGVTANANGDGGMGGSITVMGGTAVQSLGIISANGNVSSTGTEAGSGGCICLNAAYGDLTVVQNILAQGDIPDGTGGAIMLSSTGAMTLQSTAVLSVSGRGSCGVGGQVIATSTLALTDHSPWDLSGGGTGGTATVCVQAGATFTGTVDASASAPGSMGGMIAITAGDNGLGALSIQGLLNVGAGSCDATNGCGQAGCIDLTGCSVTITNGGTVDAQAPGGGQTCLTAREQLTVNGAVLANSNDPSQGCDGSNTFEYPTDKPPIIGGAATVQPPAGDLAEGRCTMLPQEAGCLVPCPVCGDGVIEFPETCDNGVIPPQNCNGCDAFCHIENCDDLDRCTIDTCDPRLGCLHTQVAPPCGTATFTATQTPAPSPTIAATATVTHPPGGCVLDVDTSGPPPDVATDVVYIARKLLGLPPVPASFRTADPSIPSDAIIGNNITAIGHGLDVDSNGAIDVATDVVYVARRLLGLSPVPASFRVAEPTIPSDPVISGNVDALCPGLSTSLRHAGAAADSRPG